MNFSDTKIIKKSLLFIIIFYIMICIVGAIFSYFYTNISVLNENTSSDSQYSNLNLYFLKVTKTGDVKIKSFGLVDIDDNDSYYITFEYSDGTTNTFLKKNDIIYYNQIKICEGVEIFKVIVDKSTKTSISLEVQISGNTYNSQYVLN